MSKAIHFSGLNGLRAIAALGVLFAHTTMSLDSFGLDAHIFGTNEDGSPRSTSLAGFGVSIFFALSGFLITYLLLVEKKLKGDINVRDFYVRRMLRIWPLYYLYLGLSMVTVIVFKMPFDGSSLIFYIFILANVPFIFGTAINFLGHYWSLGVEEQFYCFWPWIVKNSKSILRTTIVMALVLIFAKVVLRFSDMIFNNGEFGPLYQALHVTRFHCMLIGAAGAILYFQDNAAFLKIANSVAAQLISWLIIGLVAVNKFHIISFLDNEIISVVSVAVIIGQIQRTNRIVNLNNSLFDFIGKISYGIYVIHPLVIFYMTQLISFQNQNNRLSYLVVYCAVLIVVIVLAFLSYEYYEKRFLKLKMRYTTVESSPVAPKGKEALVDVYNK